MEPVDGETEVSVFALDAHFVPGEIVEAETCRRRHFRFARSQIDAYLFSFTSDKESIVFIFRKNTPFCYDLIILSLLFAVSISHFERSRLQDDETVVGAPGGQQKQGVRSRCPEAETQFRRRSGLLQR